MASNSLVGNQVLVSKVYFPRVFIPLASIGALLLDLVVSMLLLVVLMFWYHWRVTSALVWSPLYVIGTILAAGGLGLILSGLNVRFRDVKYAVPFLIQMGLFVSPVIYPLRYVPPRFRWLMGLNPMAGMIDGFRASVIGGDMDWPLVGISFLTCVVLFVGGLYLFRRMERRFADII
jgi:lipopolysaccharide transport system permease protein